MKEQIYKSKRGAVHYWLNDEFDQFSVTLVFLHGLTADHTLFDKQVEHFKDSYNLLVWDAPAHGCSGPYTDFTYPNAVDDLKHILDEHHIEQCVMIGQSMGGYIIQTFLKAYPEMVLAFISNAMRILALPNGVLPTSLSFLEATWNLYPQISQSALARNWNM